MIGNVWEWTTTRYSAHHHHRRFVLPSAGCFGAARSDGEPGPLKAAFPHLCAPEYCHQYRPAARSPQSQDTSTTHIGFRSPPDAEQTQLPRF